MSVHVEGVDERLHREQRLGGGLVLDLAGQLRDVHEAIMVVTIEIA